MKWAAFRHSKAFTTLVVDLALFTDVFLYGLIVPILPATLTERLGADESQVQPWIAYLLCSFGVANVLASRKFYAGPHMMQVVLTQDALAIVGAISDRVPSRQAPFLLGLVALFLSTALFWAARSLTVYIVARVLQGMSAAVVWIIGLAILVDTWEPEKIGRAMSIVSLVNVLGTLLGPTAGAFIFHFLGYDAVFATALGLIAVDAALRMAIPGTLSSKVALSAADQGEHRPLLDPSMPPHAAALEPAMPAPSAAATEGPSSIEIGVALLKSPRLCVDMLSYGILQTLLTAFDAVLPLFAQKTFGANALQGGLYFVPLTLVAFSSPLLGRLIDRCGPRIPCTIGFVLAAGALWGMSLVHQNDLPSKILLIAMLVIFGGAHSLKEVSLFADISLALDDLVATDAVIGKHGKANATGLAYGMIGVSTGLGMMTGPLLAGLVSADYGFTVMFIVLGVVSLAASLPVWLFVGRSRGNEEARSTGAAAAG